MWENIGKLFLTMKYQRSAVDFSLGGYWVVPRCCVRTSKKMLKFVVSRKIVV